MNVQLKQTPLTYRATVFFLLAALLASFVFFGLAPSNKISPEEMTRFSALINEGNFSAAKAIYDKAQANSSINTEELSSMKKVVENTALSLSQGIQAKQFNPPPPEYGEGLKLFADWLEPTFTTELAHLKELYLSQTISYEDINFYLRTLQSLGIFPDKLKEYEALIAQEEDRRLVPYNGPVSHIFFHPLIAYPELAFDGDVKARGYNEYFVTVPEFNKIIGSLYKKGFILIDINSLWEPAASGERQIVKKKELRLPPGKKPLIISVDDLNYYDYMKQNGNVYKLVLDEKGDVVTYGVNPQGQEVTIDDNEIIPLLDQFVQKHPDFSFRGAKGIIALTGYEGILGYRTDLLDSPSYAAEKDQALAVVKRLKETGWTFASHSYGHPNFFNVSLSKVVRDTAKWKAEVEPLVGPTNVFIFPYGTHVFPADPKAKHLIEAGFNVHCYVGASNYLQYTKDAVIMDRWHMDGMAILKQGSRMRPFFDSKDVADPVRPPL